MALEASDRLIDIIWGNWRCNGVCISRPTFKISASLLDIMGMKVSLSTVKQVLYRHNLKGRSARKKPLHQNHHKTARLRFATAHGDKVRTFWRNVLWSDETKTELKKCVRERRPTNLSYTSSVRRNWPKFCGSLWKATRNVWPKLNNLKAMLPNTKWVYGNFWPTGNVMK